MLDCSFLCKLYCIKSGAFNMYIVCEIKINIYAYFVNVYFEYNIIVIILIVNRFLSQN